MASSNQDYDIFQYKAPWPVYGLAWSYRKDNPFRLAIGSFAEEYNNAVRIVSLDKENKDFKDILELPHAYPPTKVGFVPDMESEKRDLLATTGDCLRIWEVESNSLKTTRKLSNNRPSEYCAPLTSFDWNTEDRSLVGTSSIDTTCTVWNIETQQVKTQLIAHDREVYDFAFANGTDLFASVGADGSVRLFDLRSLEYSTIIYETDELGSMMRVQWNKNDSYYLATVTMESSKCTVLDIRVPQQPVVEFEESNLPEGSYMNALAWAPRSKFHISTAGESGRAMIWDLSVLPNSVDAPVLSFDAYQPIDNLAWSAAAPDWIALATSHTVQAILV